MRAAFALCAILCAPSAAAEPVVQDRYGPPRRAPTAAAAVPEPAPQKLADYHGPMLGWAGKRAPAAPPPAATEVAVRPAPTPMARTFRAPAAPPAPRPAALAPPVTQAPIAEPAAPAASPTPRPAPPPPPARVAAPQSLYDAPPPAAHAAPSPAPASGAAPSRLYSLHREYGMAPDTLPPLPARSTYVLIGPGEPPPDEDEPDKAARPAIDTRLF